MANKQTIGILLVLSTLMVLLFGTLTAAKTDGYDGYLSDVLCAVNGVSAGGFNLTASPEKHTVMCMQMPPCESSGYGVFMKDAQSGKYVFYKFDSQGNELAKKLLKNTQKADHMRIVVTGSMGNGMIKVDQLVEG